ncbi:signal peptide peptidase SppA [Balneolales bacterium ANBcel1]|nr:signal peptide peptidase SppA [Balneolales bacterium ANBcel1]
MMGFFKTFFATLLAIIVSFFFLFLIGMILVISSQKETEPYVRDGSVLEIRMGMTLSERPPDDPLSLLFQESSRAPVTLRGLESSLTKAAADDRIEGVWFQVNNLSASWNHLVALREMMLTFREESGKFIYVSTDDLGFNEQSYFLATAADSIFSPPETFFEFDGFFMQTVFFSEFLDKIGVEAEIFRAGAYKSAMEPLYRNDLSDENREQMRAIIDNVADTFLSAVSERTGMSRDELDTIMNEAQIFTSRSAYEQGLIDALVYPDELETRIEERIKEMGHREMRTIRFGRYNRVSPSGAGVEQVSTSNKIAVIYANGNIMPETSEPGMFPGSTDNITARNLSENIESALEDDDVKAIVLRINSPGGSGATSDLIWHKVKRAAEEKPVIASFGSVAASGGYYIGMSADTIVASSQTITGSIGVFGAHMNMQELLNNKLGIYFDEVTSHEQAIWGSPDKPLDEMTRRMIQSYVDDFYDVFLNRVAESRNMTPEDVHEVAQGRVWTGPDALETGLVDVIGELDTAISIAAEKAGIDEYNIEMLPRPKSLFDLFSGSAQAQIRYFMNPGLKELESLDPIIHILRNDPRTAIARIPFDHKIH